MVFVPDDEGTLMTIHFKIHAERAPELQLRRAILLYENRKAANGYFATLHDVALSESGKPKILAGKPLTLAASRGILAGLSRDAHGGSFLPECVLMASADELMWYEPPQVRHLGFKRSTQFPKRSPGTMAGHAPTPGVIFHVGESIWRVFAFKGKGRPSPETPLFHAPTLNTYEDGGICVGTVRTPGATTAECIRAWSDAFWRSNFTHANYDNVVQYQGDAPALWRDAIAGRFRGRFPSRVLKPHGFTTGEYIERIRRNRCKN